MARKRVSQGRTQNPPAVRRFKPSFRWKGVELEPYKLAAHRAGEFQGASRQVLIGRLGEQVKFHVRYFELNAGGFTSLERHHHAHVVIGLRGRGRVRVANRKFELGPMDTIYIAPDQPHQLRASGAEPFGFFCIVDAKRDRPRPVKS
ncbi:MAG TPA: cupin domain-containing protein [Candidatus Binataceae bacterium]|nr:cupin domain-containing protein [Candidatus Binataceae bacterium]